MNTQNKNPLKEAIRSSISERLGSSDTKNYMTDFSDVAQQVWGVKTVEEKQKIMLDAVKGFAAKGKDGANVKRFERSIQNARSANELDKIAAQLALFPDNKVV